MVENADPLSSPIASPTCQHSGELMHDTPDAWCQAIDMAGLCVFPCDTDEDCPNQIREFCDHTYPNPGNARQGVCRYHSMPSIPTPLNEVMP